MAEFFQARGYTQQYDAFLVPFKDAATGLTNNQGLMSIIASSAVSITAFAIGGAMGLTGVLQLEQDKGNVITAHRVDGGYALTQRGGKHDDRVFIRVILTGRYRYFFKEILSFYADNKSIPLAFLSRGVRLAKCQIESLKMIENSERQQAMILHLIFRQLRTFQDNVYANVLNTGLALIAGSEFMSETNLYDNAQTPGVSSVGFDVLANVADAGALAAVGIAGD